MRPTIFAIMIFAFIGCAHQEPLSKSTRKESRITVEWMDTRHAVGQRCHEAGAPAEYEVYGCAVQEADQCKIILTEPRHWRDNYTLAHLGHEVWHCLGAKHREKY